MPPKIRDLKKRLRKAGFELEPGRGKGDHCVFLHDELPDVMVVLDGKDGDDAHKYQERDVQFAIRRADERARK